MKNLTKAFMFILFSATLICVTSGGKLDFVNALLQAGANPNAQKEENSSTRDVSICIDPRIEFISVVFSMTAWDKMLDSWLDHDYKNYSYYHDIENTFHSFKDHKAVIIADSLVTKHSFTFDAIPQYIMFHSDPPELKQLRPYDEYIIGRAGGDKRILEEFTVALRDFATATDFNQFYNAHAEFYNSLTKGVKTEFPGVKTVSTLENFFGWKLNSYNVIVAPAMHPMGGYGIRIPANNNYDSYNIMRVSGIKDDKPYFGTLEEIYYIALHEYGHTFVNPTTEKYTNQINDLRHLYQNVERKLAGMPRGNYYGHWINKYNEQLLNSLTAYIAQMDGDSTGVNTMLTWNDKKGLYLTRQIADLYNLYSNSRDEYPTFDTFYPVIFQAYRDQADEIYKQYHENDSTQTMAGTWELESTSATESEIVHISTDGTWAKVVVRVVAGNLESEIFTGTSSIEGDRVEFRVNETSETFEVPWKVEYGKLIFDLGDGLTMTYQRRS